MCLKTNGDENVCISLKRKTSLSYLAHIYPEHSLKKIFIFQVEFFSQPFALCLSWGLFRSMLLVCVVGSAVPLHVFERVWVCVLDQKYCKSL